MIPIPTAMWSCLCGVVSASFPSYSIVFLQSIFYFCLSPLLFPFLLNVFGQLFLSGCTLLFCLPPFSPILMCTFLLPPFPSSSSSPSLIVSPPPPSLRCCSSSTFCHCLSSSSSSSPPWWLRVNSWRCCSIASVCPACRANPTPHQALGPSTPTKYFYLFIHPRPSGASWR